MQKTGYFLVSLRPKQWVKNVFIFAPMIFSLHLFQLAYIRNSLIAFFLFSLVSGSVYVFNDVIDRKKDQFHPEKKNRPIAAGKLGIPAALTSAGILLLMVLLAAAELNRAFFLIALVYCLVNVLYSLLLKTVVIIDIMIIALGFVLRVMAGGAINRIPLYPWILISTFLLAIFLALIKRRQELLKMKKEDPGLPTRLTLKSYNVSLLDQMISISTAATLISYIMYVLSPEVQVKFHSQRLYYTVPFVIFGIFRYLFLSYTKGEGESPSEIIYTDLPFTLNIILWVVVFIVLVRTPLG
jgi:4-hydroxybenzoate polyprenyltransferase